MNSRFGDVPSGEYLRGDENEAGNDGPTGDTCLRQRRDDASGRDSTRRIRSAWREMPSLRYARRISTLTVLVRRPVASPISSAVLPWASITATWLSAALRPRDAATTPASCRGRLDASTTR